MNQLTQYTPTNGATNIATSINLDWTSTAGVAGYLFQYDVNQNFNSPNLYNGNAGTTSDATVYNLLYNTTYYWRIRVYNNTDTSAWSTVWSFTTGAATSNLSAVDLGAAGNYVILAKTAVNNVPTSAVTGDIGLSPAATSFVTGFALVNATGYATAAQVTGKIYAADMAAPTPTNLTSGVSFANLTRYANYRRPCFPEFALRPSSNIDFPRINTELTSQRVVISSAAVPCASIVDFNPTEVRWHE